jgi:hypothetical protein
MLFEMDDVIGRIEINKIDGEQHADGVDSVGGRKPDAIGWPHADSAQRSFQAHQQRVGCDHTHTEKRFAGSIEDAIYLFHVSCLKKGAAGRRSSSEHARQPPRMV